MPALFKQKPFTVKQLQFFSTRMAAMLETGITVHKALEFLTKQSKREGRLSAALVFIRQRVNEGEQLSAAVRQSGKFTEFFAAMLEIGEESGDMAGVFKELARYYAWKDASMRGIKSAFIYPKIVAVLLIGAVIMALNMIIPAYAGLFEQLDAVLPAPTLALIAASDFLRAYYITIIITAAVVAAAVAAFLRTHRGRYVRDYLLLNAPITRVVYRGLYNYLAAHTLSIMLNAGVSATKAVQTAFLTIGSPIMADAGSVIAQGIINGESISTGFKKSRYFDYMLISAIETGEETGRMGQMLQAAATYAKNELEQTVKNLSVLIEPVITIILGIVICAVLMAVVLPTFSLM